MAEGCTIKGSDGLYVTWDPAKATPSAVHLSRSVQMPGSTWELGYAGFAIKVGTPGLQLCLSVRPGKALHREYGVELARCGSGQSQRWTVNGTFTFGKRISIESLAHRGTCLTVRGSGRDRKPKRPALVLERCARGGGAGDQTWST
jgi:hypothetical protein